MKESKESRRNRRFGVLRPRPPRSFVSLSLVSPSFPPARPPLHFVFKTGFRISFSVFVLQVVVSFSSKNVNSLVHGGKRERAREEYTKSLCRASRPPPPRPFPSLLSPRPDPERVMRGVWCVLGVRVLRGGRLLFVILAVRPPLKKERESAWRGG